MYFVMVCLKRKKIRGLVYFYSHALLFLSIKCNFGYQRCPGYEPFLNFLLERNWKKKKAKKRGQYAFYRKWPPVFFGKFMGQNLKGFLKEKCVRLKGECNERFFPNA